MEIFVTLVGVTFRPVEAKEIVKHLTPADGNLLSLEAEPDNPYDSNAVKVIHDPSGMHIGYLAKENNYEISCALAEGKELMVEITGFENTLKPVLLVTDVPNEDILDKMEINAAPYKPTLGDVV